MDMERTNTLTLSLLREARAYNLWIFKKIRPYLGEKVLEVGCGIGNLTGLLLRHNKVMVADMNEGYLREVEGKYPAHPNLIGKLTWNIQQAPPSVLNESCDTILCSNVLEHVADDHEVLKNFYHLLPAGGRLIILVPALKILYNVLDKELGHFRRYGWKELTQRLAGNGFKICYLKYFNFFGILGWFINGTILKRRTLSAKQIGIFNTMVPLFVELEKFIPTLIGLSLIAIGEKDSKGGRT